VPGYLRYRAWSFLPIDGSMRDPGYLGSECFVTLMATARKTWSRIASQARAGHGVRLYNPSPVVLADCNGAQGRCRPAQK
jgi:hypothetical protein